MSTNVNEVATQLTKGGLNSLNPEQQAFYEANKAEVEAARRNAELAKGLAGPDDPPVGDIARFSAKDETMDGGELQTVNVTAKKPNWWQRNKGAIVGVGSVLALVGGAILTATGIGSGAGLALMAVGGAGLLTSCTKEDSNFRKSIYVNQSIDINMNIVNDYSAIEDKLDKLIDLLTQMRYGQEASQETLEDLLTSLNALGANVATIMRILINMGTDFSTIIELLKNIDNSNQMQTKLLQSLCRGNEKLYNLIMKFMNQQNTLGAEQNNLLTKILQMLSHIDQTQTEQLNIIANIAGRVESMDDRDAEMYNNFLDKLEQLTNGQQNLYNLGLQILAKIPDNANASDYAAILQEISNKLSGIQGTLEGKLTTIISNQNTLNADLLAGIQALINNNDTNTANIIAAMDRNEAALALEIQGLGVKLDGISQTVTADLAQIIQNQGTIINNQQVIHNVLANDIKPIILAIKTKVESMSDQAILAKLQAIYDKIPDGCHCQTLDLTSIINKLDIIINNLNNGDSSSGSNEGRMDDLDSELG